MTRKRSRKTPKRKHSKRIRSAKAQLIQFTPYAGHNALICFMHPDSINSYSIMTSEVNSSVRNFSVYTDIKVTIPKQNQEDDGIFDQPKWAFMVSNGQDEIFVNYNASQWCLTTRTKKSSLETYVKLTEEQARNIYNEFFAKLNQFDVTVKNYGQVVFKPIGWGYTWKAKHTEYIFD